MASPLKAVGYSSFSSLQWATAILTIFILHRLRKFYKRLRLMPPGPRGLPLLGNVLQAPLSSMPWFKFTEWSKEYGSIFSLNMAGQPVIVLNTYKAANDLLERRSNIYSDRPQLIVLNELLTGGMSIAFSPYGEVTKKLRRAAHSGFNQHAVVKYAPRQMREALYTTIALLNSSDNWDSHFKRSTASAILGNIYDWDIITDENEPLVKSISAAGSRLTEAGVPGAYLVEYIPVLKYLPTWMAKFKREALEWHFKHTEMFDGFNKDAKKRKVSGNLNQCFAGDIVDKEDQHNISLTEAAWVTGFLFIAGAQTTMETLTYFVLAMVLNPESMRRAHKELDEVIGRQHPPSSSDVNKLPYIQALVKEVMRWRPIAPMGVAHRTSQDDWYEDHFIPKGTIVIPNIWAINRDPNVYSDFADFRPERHLEPVPEGANPLGHSTFGFGRRICVGMYHANQNLCITVAAVLWATIIQPESDANGNPIIPADDQFVDSGLTVGPKPFKCKMLPRFPEALDLLKTELAQDI